MTNELFDIMIQAAIGTGAAMLLVLMLRRRVHAAFGARTAYALWLIVPVAMVASLLPAGFVITNDSAIQQTVTPSAESSISLTADIVAKPVVATATTGPQTAQPTAETDAKITPSDLPGGWLMALWLAGTAISLAGLAYGQHRFMKRHGLRAQSGKKRVSRHADVGPAVLGFVAPRIVVPSDFRDTYSPLERKLILAHEQAHIRAGDMQMNALAIAIRSLNWFNPLAYIAYGFFRTDQEMACDERVMHRFGQHRRAYAETLLKSQLMGERAPLGCSWFGDTRHPLKDRVTRLARKELSPARRILGIGMLLGATSLTGVAAWATLSTQVIYLEAGDAGAQVVQADSFINPEIGMGGGLGGRTEDEPKDLTDDLTDDLADAQAVALVNAIRERRDNHIRALLNAGVNVNYHVKGEGTPLLAAASIGDREMAHTLLKAGADINQTSPGDGTALLVAARNGDKAMVEFLLEAGADVNGYSPGDGTPLLVTARSGNPAIVELLLEAGANINQVAPGDGTPLLVAVRQGNPAMVELLLEAGGDINKVAPGDGTPLIAAVRSGSENMVTALLDLGADVNGYAPGDGSPLVSAVRQGNDAMVDLLLKSGADVNKAVPGDANPLIMASAIGDLKMVTRLVEVGADVNSFVLGDETPLIAAARAGELEVVKFLLDKGADVNMRVLSGHEHPRSRYRTALGQALRYGHDDVVTYLRKKGAADPAEQEDR